jgi:hypothetical protein
VCDRILSLVIQHAKRMRHIILPSVACLAVPQFSTLSHKRHDFGEKMYRTKMCFWFALQLLSQTFLIIGRIQRDTKKMCVRPHVEPPLSFQTLIKYEFSQTHFRKILKYQIPWKSVQWEPTCSMQTERQADGRTDMTKRILVFCNCSKASKMSCQLNRSPLLETVLRWTSAALTSTLFLSVLYAK